jgi:hypothetical protein
LKKHLEAGGGSNEFWSFRRILPRLPDEEY